MPVQQRQITSSSRTPSKEANDAPSSKVAPAAVIDSDFFAGYWINGMDAS